MSLWNATSLSAALPVYGEESPPAVVVECRSVHQYNVSQQCAFVTNLTECHTDGGFFDYTNFVYCGLRSSLVPLAICILVSWLVFIFVALAVSADDFFCPSLVVISKTLRLSDNVAGVTLLAFGNGAPDVFSAIAAIRESKSGDTGLAFGALLGAGVFIMTVVAGSVCIAQPFEMMQRPFLRDAIFYLATVYMTFFVLCDGYITLLEAISFILMYVVYVIIVIIARCVYQHRKRRRQRERLSRVDSSVSASNLVINTASVDQGEDPEEDRLDQPVYSEHPHVHGHGLGRHCHHGNDPGHEHNTDHEQYTRYGEIEGVDETTPLVRERPDAEVEVAQPRPGKRFLHAISPVDIGEWRSTGVMFRILAVIKGIAKFFLRLTVPVVDYDAYNHNWNRHLSSLHCVTAPLIACYLSGPQAFLHYIHGVFPVWAVLLMAGLVLAGVVFFTSQNDAPPRYHSAFAYLGFIVAITWIQAIATEAVNVLQTLGVVFDIGNTILGLTLLAMGNSIADLIADVTMARQGFPRTGISACYGGPMFNLLLGIGIPFTIKCAARGGKIEMTLTLIELVLIGSLFVILAFSLIAIPFVLKFKMTKRFGFVLFFLYALFLVMIVLAETGKIGGGHFFLQWCHVNP